jgi:Lon protease-like protein
MANNNFQTLPALPLKNTILFPGLLLPLSVGREASFKAVQAALKSEEKEILLIAQRDPQVENPEQNDLYTVGTKAVIRKSSRLNDGVMEILVLGVERVVVMKLDNGGGYLTAKYRVLALPEDGGSEVEALSGALLELAAKAIALAQPQTAPEMTRMLEGCGARTGATRSGDARGRPAPDSLLCLARIAGVRAPSEDCLNGARRDVQRAERLLAETAIARDSAGAGRERRREGRSRNPARAFREGQLAGRGEEGI